jgi:tetratricopeptide (TPR) repeat protein
MNALRSLTKLSIWLLSLFFAAPAFCAPGAGGKDLCQRDPVCREHTAAALKLYNDRRYEDALRAFRTAYRIKAEPLLLLNIGRCLYRLGQPEEALEQYRQFQELAPNPDEPTQQSVARYIDEAQADVTAKKQAAAIPPPVVPPPPPPRPVYKKWWFWTIGAVVVSGAVVGLGLGLTLGRGQEPYVDFTWRAP